MNLQFCTLNVNGKSIYILVSTAVIVIVIVMKVELSIFGILLPYLLEQGLLHIHKLSSKVNANILSCHPIASSIL
jgi:hypothetical protein